MKENFYDIDALLVKYLLGEASPEEQMSVEQWIASENVNRKYFDDFKMIWEKSKKLTDESTLDPDVAWQKLRNRIHKAPLKQASVRSLQSFRWLKIAAIVFFIGGAAIVFYSIFNKNEIKTLAINSLDKVVIDTLPDKSIITLNKNSTLDYPQEFLGDSRSVTLKGEAFFSISPNKAKPFIIYVNDVTIKVVGTSFNVKSINGSTEVIVETGIVEVIRKNREIALHPNEGILINKSDSTSTKENEKGKLYNYYRTKEFECDNTPLWQLAQVLSEVYDVDVIIGSKELRNLPITSTFKDESLDNILDIIRQTFNISVTKAGKEIILK